MQDEPEPDTPIISTLDGEVEQAEVVTQENYSHTNGPPSRSGEPPVQEVEERVPVINGSIASANGMASPEASRENVEHEDIADSTSQSRGTSVAEPAGSTTTTDALDGQTDELDLRFDALAREKQALQNEVAELRKSIEAMQGKHEEDLTDIRGQMEETQGEKEHVETQYRTLLGKVNTIKSQLGERLKADAVCMNSLQYPNSTDVKSGRAISGEKSNRRTGGAMR